MKKWVVMSVLVISVLVFTMCNKAGVFTQRPGSIIEGATSFWNCTGQLSIRKAKSGIHNNNKKGGDGQAEGTAFFQPEVPAEIHA